MNKKPFYCYRLKYPQGFIADSGVDLSGVVFYVGKGTPSPHWTNVERMDHHEVEARSECDCKKCCAIRQIWERGLQVDKAKLYEHNDEARVLAYEQECIEHTYAGPYLTNIKYNRPKKVQHVETDEQRHVRLFVQHTANQVMREIVAKHRK